MIKPEWSRRLGYIVNTRTFVAKYRDERQRFVKESTRAEDYEVASKFVKDIVDDCEKNHGSYQLRVSDFFVHMHWLNGGKG